jgi:hypothetical protein
MGVYRGRSCWAVSFFLRIEVRRLPGPQWRGTGGTLSVDFGVSRSGPPAVNSPAPFLGHGAPEFASVRNFREDRPNVLNSDFKNLPHLVRASA